MFSGIIQCRHKYKTIKRDTAPPGVGLGQESGSTKQLFPSKTLCSCWLLWPVADQPEILQFPAGRGIERRKSRYRVHQIGVRKTSRHILMKPCTGSVIQVLFISAFCSAAGTALRCVSGSCSAMRAKRGAEHKTGWIPFRFACFLWYYCGISLTEYLSLPVFQTVFPYRNQTLYRSDEDIHRGNIICHAR